MINANIQKDQFQGRLQRIKKGGPNTLGHVYVGPVEEGGTTTQRRHFGILATVAAFVFGVSAYFVGHLAQFHLAGDLERLGAEALMVAETSGDLIVAGLLLFILIRVTRMRGVGPFLVGAMGLFAMMGLHAFSVQMAPELYSGLYSEGYVSQYLDAGNLTAF